MPVPILAASGALSLVGKIGTGVAKVGKKIGNFFGKLFGGKKKRKRQRAAAKANRIEKAANEVLARKVQKLEDQARLGEARAKVKLAKIEKQLAKQGISFDPGVQDATVSDVSFNIPEIFQRRRGPGVFQERPEPDFPAGMAQATGTVRPAAGGLGFRLTEPLVLLSIGAILLLLFGRGGR
jgi:hypothetical protein